ncbi:MAG: thiamine phosphate synthase [Acidobacteria bacterium]|nr:thiamine phosphate synthase [Acidobacteriota bacterium]
MLLYYITDRTQFPGGESERRGRLLEKIAEAARAGVDYVQVREKDLCGRDLESLVRDAVELVEQANGRTRLLVNSRTDVALAANAHGVHLRSADVSPAEVKKIWQAGAGGRRPVVAVSCHDRLEVASAEKSGAEFVVFGPVFAPKGPWQAKASDELLQVSRNPIPVLALGGVTLENAHGCVAAGASGIAGIRLFQKNEISRVAEKLRGEWGR